MIDPALEQHILRLKPFLDAKAHQFHSREFIGEDPVSIPHRFSLRQDIEIAAFLTAILSWGRRPLILKSALRLMEILDNSPYQFITQCKAKDIKKIDHFVHRTFNTEDLHNFLLMLKKHYRTSPTLETAFCIPKQYDPHPTANRLRVFHGYFFDSLPMGSNTYRHVANPYSEGACKRMNMFLRWMVRTNSPVDFGLWANISPADLVMPLDVHVAHEACKLSLLPNEKLSWKNAIQLTELCSLLNPTDPTFYDYAFFGMGVNGSLYGDSAIDGTLF